MLTVDHDEGMHVIRHDDEGIHLDVEVVRWKSFQFRVCGETQLRKLDQTVRDLPKDWRAIVRMLVTKYQPRER